MSAEALIALVASIFGGLIVAIANQLMTQDKTKAEAKKLEAEAEKTKAETAKILNDLNLIPFDDSGQLPDGWVHAGSRPEDYEIGFDKIFVNSGRASGFIKSKRPSAGFGTLMQSF